MFAPKLLGFEFLTVILRCSASKGYVHSKARKLWLWNISGPTTLEKGSSVCMMAPAPSLCLSLICCLLSRGLNHVSPKHSVCLSTNTKTSEHADIWKFFFKKILTYLYLCLSVWWANVSPWETQHNTRRPALTLYSVFEAGSLSLLLYCILEHQAYSPIFIHLPPHQRNAGTTGTHKCFLNSRHRPKVHTSNSYALGIDPSQSGL